MEIVLAKQIMNANNVLAQVNRERFDAMEIYGVNMLGSPGAGKTTVLEVMLPKLIGAGRRPVVVEGDLATSRDAERIRATGVDSVQINTEGGCHLDANMIAESLKPLDLESADLLFIENVGNLVCTAGFDLGERLRIVVLSVAEGDDKVRKYPNMFRRADLVFLNKIDLLPYCDFDVEAFRADLRHVSPEAIPFELSARTGQGIDEAAEAVGQRLKEWRENR